MSDEAYEAFMEATYDQPTKMNPVSFTLTISPEDVEAYSNLGYEVEQKHLDMAAELYEEKINEYFSDDLFHFLLAAKQYVEDDEA